ncbi:MAG: uncharacterized protein K0S70_1655 [Microbacterium sp.]|jgi:hypothetical protein|uniref:glycosyltransferase family protein n=1 Tax=Microbacterium sp. AG238 TaxID=2183994 RepID=UPI000FF31346|nr:glycosyltransferase [Microbacterium sp. AG238]MDF2917438.1 uncharacterized protein [Microbacterium sp.]RKE60107.1 hypothetical protein DEU36_2539 [Microbacterium sp. AG238]
MRPDVRARVRALRGTRVIGPVVRAADRVWWWRVIRRSGLVDSSYYAAQLGLPQMPVEAAVWHYIVRGFRRGYSVNPLFDEIHAGGVLPEVYRVPALYAYLLSDRPTVDVHPLWDARALGGDGASGALERLWALRHTEIPLRVGGESQLLTVTDFRSRAIDAARRWRRAGRTAAPAPARGDRMLALIQHRDRRYGAKVHQAGRFAQRDGATAILALVDPDLSQWVTASIAAEAVDGCTLRRYGRRPIWGTVVSESLHGWSDGHLVALDPRGSFSDDDVDRLLVRARDGVIAVPAVREHDGTLVGIGAAAVDHHGSLYRILAGHPVEDLAGLGSEISVPRLCGIAFASHSSRLTHPEARAAISDALDLEDVSDVIARDREAVVLPDVTTVLDEPAAAFDRSRRPLRSFDGVRTDREAAERILRAAGFDVSGWQKGARTRRPSPTMTWRRPSAHSQRWAIKICSPAGPRGDVWGDTHFAQGLAAALRRRGHDVIIDHFGAARRPSAHLDDVNVVVRGPYRIDPPSTGVNLQWIISHPDEVSRGEIAQFDQVFAASKTWSEKVSRQWSVPVEPLLECVDTDKFVPRGLPRTAEIVFVGTARGIARPSVVAPIRAGVDVKVYGPDWRPFIPASAVVAERIPNEALPERYETAAVVLNDQWPAMREEGFIAMRPFDVVAVGGRVISEPVDGIEEIFGGAVVTYRSPQHLVEMLRGNLDMLFPDDDELRLISRRIREQHSFDARAAVLQKAAQKVADQTAGSIMQFGSAGNRVGGASE